MGQRDQSAEQEVIESRPEQTWWSILKGLLFGFDYFISYSRDARSIVYATELQQQLGERDFVCFRDATHLKAGDSLTLRIRLGLRRTKCLLVLGTERALDSDWVEREIGYFSESGRPIVPLDLEEIRERHTWKPLQDAFFVNDTLPDPSPRALDEIVRSFGGWRANRVARWSSLAAAALLLVIGATMIIQALALNERSERLFNQSLYSIAQSLDDPVKRSLVMLEIDREKLPLDAVELIRKTAGETVPVAALRATNAEAEFISFLRDGRLVSVDEAGSVRIWKADGLSDPETLGALPKWADHYGITGQETAVYAADDDTISLLFFDGRRATTSLQNEESVTNDDDGIEVVERWTVADRHSAWRVSRCGERIAHMADRESVEFYETSVEPGEVVALLELPGMAALDITVDFEPAPTNIISGQILTTSGQLLDYRISAEGPSVSHVRNLINLAAGDSFTLGESADQAAFHAHGTRILAGLKDISDATARLIWSNPAPDSQLQHYSPESNIDSWKVSGDGDHALVVLEDGQSVLLNLETSEITAVPLTAQDPSIGLGPNESLRHSEDDDDEKPADRIVAANLSPTGDAVVMAENPQAWMWSRSLGLLTRLKPEMFFNSCKPCFSHDGSLLATADAIGEIRIWPVLGQTSDPMIVDLGDRAYSLGIGPSGTVITGSYNGAVHHVTLAENSFDHRVIDHGPPERIACAVNAAGTRAAVVFDDGAVRVYSLPSGSKEAQFALEPAESEQNVYYEAVWCDDATIVVTGGKQVTKWSSETGPDPIKVGRDVSELHLSRAGSHVLTQSENGTLRLFSSTNPQDVSQTQVEGQIWTASVSETGDRVLLTQDDGVAIHWHTKSGRLDRTVVAEGQILMSGALSPDGKLFAIGTEAGRVGISRLDSKQITWLETPNLKQASDEPDSKLAHVGVVADVLFSRDSRWLITAGGMDGTCQIWKSDGSHVMALNLRGIPSDLDILNDGRVVTLGEAGQLSVWRVGNDTLLDFLRSRTTATLLPSERVRYLGETIDEARARYTEQEHQFNRTPLLDRYGEVDLDL